MKWVTHLNHLKPRYHQDCLSLPPQHKSSRLAEKSKTTEGKGAIQVAKKLLVKKKKKTGRLSPPTTQEGADQFNFYAQHFERPLTKEKMDALTVLIASGPQKSKKKRGKLTKVESRNTQEQLEV